MLLPNPTPKLHVADLSLTKDQATHLLSNTTALLKLISEQLSAIHHLPHLDLTFIPGLRFIQQRHLLMQTTLKRLVDDAKCGPHTVLLDLQDSFQAARMKVRRCNLMSAPGQMGWKRGALVYWPLIAESYVLLGEKLENLKRECEDVLGDEEGCGRKRGSEGRARVGWFGAKATTMVRFDREVRARWVNVGGEDEKEEFKMGLMGDRRKSARKITSRRAGAGQEVHSESEGNECSDEEAFGSNDAPVPP